MADVKIPTKANFNTVGELQNKCNLKERSLEGGKLKSFKAIGNAETHETELTFEETPGAPFGAGNLKMKEDEAASDTAWIKGKKTKVSFS